MFITIALPLSLISIISQVFCQSAGQPTIDIVELVTRSGYQIEKHELLTEDGYFLDIFRLPPRCLGTKSCNGSDINEPVLLMHGLLGTSENFVINGRDSMGFFLNDRGYDVWLGNARGTFHSRRHRTLDPDKDKEFWEFTWHEIGIYDLSAMIDHILTTTRRQKMSFVGHSQGSTIFYVLCSERPAYNEKLKIHISLSPGTFLSHVENIVMNIFPPYFQNLKVLPEQIGFIEVEAIFRNPLFYTIVKTFCVSNNQILLDICQYVFDILVDNNGNNIDKYFIPYLTEVTPGGSSIFQFLHYLQSIVTGGFGQYDWGRDINLKKYNSEYPTTYNLSKITTPVALYYGPNDCVVVPKEELSSRNGYATEKHEVETDDGYLLDIFRIIPKRTRISEIKKHHFPVFLLHGLFGSAENYALMGNESLAFILTNAGYDVWLGNVRGTWHSRKHRVLDPDKDEAFWKFTWHEFGVYDVPAMIDYILKVTGKQQLNYVAHSQGATSFLVMCSERPGYNEKIKVQISLAPASFFNNNDVPSLTGIYEIKAIFRLRLLYTFAKTICVNNNLNLRRICKGLLVALSDPFGNDLMDDNWLPFISDTMPAGLSLYQIFHYFQSYGTGSFAQYDWGRETNLEKYQSETPKVYNLSQVTAPMDVERLISSLPNVLEFDAVADHRWAHTNFLFARNIIPLSYKWVMQSLKRYG
ncbi:unnamed protein product [Phaedon cochleariae]|uniref:Partial AB-hydrolase lipase domain-containing protein n=1 Tax=Phaedon cochleariae TaxID=80249 RepID=A0A9N9SL90_PHACE|nr:unnamed protein product [Phaedon cochleariae]